MSDQTLDVCPHCGVGVLIMNGKECRAASGAWVMFDCLTSIHRGHNPRMSQSRKCEDAERERLAMEVATLRTANAGLVESVKDRERERDHANAVADALVRENAGLVERVRRLEEANTIDMSGVPDYRPKLRVAS